MRPTYAKWAARAHATTIFAVISLVIGCGPNQSASNVKVTEGIETADFPSVVAIDIGGGGLCSATFVSQTTLITAAHCTVNGAVSYKGQRATQIMANPNWNGQTRNGVNGADLAVAVFPNAIAPATTPLATNPPQVGDRFTIVGYGNNDNDAGRGAGQKRYGHNTIDRLTAGGMIGFSGASRTTTASGENSSSGSGDSGGPLFIDDKLAGVTSGGTGTVSLYVNLFSQASRTHLQNAVDQGAKIPGLNGPAAGANDPGEADANPGQNAGSEKINAGATGGNGPNDGTLAGDDDLGNPGGANDRPDRRQNRLCPTGQQAFNCGGATVLCHDGTARYRELVYACVRARRR